MKRLFLLFLVASLFSCSSKPSDSDIRKKILFEYVCPGTAKVIDLKIVETEETKGTDQNHVFRYTVAGEVEWPEGCDESIRPTPKGFREKFHKTVVLTKTDDGWQ